MIGIHQGGLIMCEFCHEHGEGKKWYLQAKNYSLELLNQERKLIYYSVNNIGERVISSLKYLDSLRNSPEALKRDLPLIVAKRKKAHWGQVVTLEEIEQILDMSTDITRLPCACRSTLCGVSDARFCFGISTPPKDDAGNAQYPDYSKDIEKLTIEEAKKIFREHDHNGLVHSVWTFGTPFIGGICNCTANDCLAMKSQLRLGIPMFFKAEYVASIDWEKCSGCKNCFKNCNFGAIIFSPTSQKCYINQFQCYGCGVCRALCPRDAIILKDRNTIPLLRKEW
jgi:Pyruvate/2-oxoacid:ferredoxin oxidoreductase delta subunit